MTGDACKEMHLLMQADVDGELGPAEAARVAAHLNGCPSCTKQQQRLMALSARLRQELPDHKASTLLRQSVRAKVTSRSGLRFGPPHRWLAAAGAMGLAACLAVFAVLPRTDAMPDWIVAAHIRGLQPNHLFDVASSEQHTVKPWFAGRLPFAPPVKDLAEAGFPLAGGRLDYLPGNAAATLIYRRRQHVINLFVWPAGNDDRGSEYGLREGYNYIRWRADDMTLWAVSDLNAKELREFTTFWR